MEVASRYDVDKFNYAELDPELAEDARSLAARIRDRSRRVVLETGTDLLRIKARLGHGLFLDWIEAEFSMSDRTAQNYMQAARVFGSENEIIAHLPPTTIIELAAKSTPEPLRQKVVTLLENGERPTPATVSAWVKEAKNAQREKLAAEREAARLAKLSPEDRKLEEKRAKARRRSGEQRQRDAERQTNEMREANAHRQQAAQEAVNLITPTLGSGLQRLAELVSEAPWVTSA